MKPNEPENYLEDFEELNTEPIMSLQKIEWWLLKYSDAYAEIMLYFKEKNVNYDTKFVVYTEYQDTIMNPYMEFIYYFNFMDEISLIAKKEAFFKKELREYRQILHSREKTTQWLAKNEKVGLGDFPEFIWSYYRYFTIGGTLWIGDKWNEIGFFVDWNRFCFTLYFCKVFSELFWNQKLLPHSLGDAIDEVRKEQILYWLEYYGE
ncbi:hypothetical protein ERX46_05435 [Brumimicrobium glaciale]|uniref:Uncharacterized protein n=1 Tax=Brumimicrobium glaciale TaxID=200475 RepID=A0A4Q4KNS6_9FLAO|nr:hypothetical protein [Brumimicrobium glaciale]RYM34818.1 hypothetical protein ERX46_05435 [Brumimicrobium glaciale]